MTRLSAAQAVLDILALNDPEKRMLRLAGYITLILLLLCPQAYGLGKKPKKPRKARTETVSGSLSGQISAEEQRRFRLYYYESIRMRTMGRYSEAYELLRHALSINPNAPEALFEMAVYSLALDGEDASRKNYEKAVELAPSNLWYERTLGNFYRSHDEMEKAAEVFEKMAATDRSNSDNLYLLASIYSEMKDFEKEISVLDRIEKLEGKSESLSREKFRIYTSLGSKDKAFGEMEQLAQEYPNDLRYKVILGDLYLENDEAEKAKAIYDDVLREDPNYSLALLSLANYYQKLSMSEEYERQMTRILLNPNLSSDAKLPVMRSWIVDQNLAHRDSTVVLSMFDSILAQPQADADMATLAVQYRMERKMSPDEIKPSLYKVLDIEPGEERAINQLISYAAKENSTKDMVSICRTAVNYHPENMVYSYYLGLGLYMEGNESEAISVLTTALTQGTTPEDKQIASEMYGICGDISHSRGQDEDAYRYYDKSLELNPDNVQVLNNYAYYLALQKKDLDKAEEMSFRTIKADPKSYNELDTYAWILFLKGNYSRAHIYIDESLKNGGAEQSGIVEHAGDILFMEGDVDKALEYWNKAKELGTESKTLDRKIKERRYIEQ